ncbi:hypothetical protein P691DRAFT_726392 [Macrolepiota fuliginosa MF-IS2]|uniref:SWIM-type domain-containing protein n=1 Tax=Macrolepiota fuliginosa MF-IS2 TaxID=1400762 RepID=A0A9P5XH95_9AGAR|nr:hypothetical protein P691DRAFT_726392 [Macrolepiota fuliginosa MF-IS2]
MPRTKRPLTEISLEDVQLLPEGDGQEISTAHEQGRVPGVEDSSRPKRVRKQTQKYTSNPPTTTTKRAPRKASTRSTGKGKGKAASGPQEEPGQSPSVASESTDQPPKKRARTKKNSPAQPKAEKRLAQFRSHCPQNVLERAERVRCQRFFMIDRHREGEALKETFSVLGSTGNVYTVTIDHTPKCNCPDNLRGNHCKHIMFIFLKVLCVPISSHIWYQKALLTSELESVFSHAPEAPNSVTNPRVREAFLRATGQLAESSTAAAANSKKRIPGEEDDCPICYDTMYGVVETTLVFCEECGNALHKECFMQYEKSARQSGRAITCVWCRSNWGVAAPAKPAGATRRGAFINLADVV